jgi:hypothetical protein
VQRAPTTSMEFCSVGGRVKEVLRRKEACSMSQPDMRESSAGDHIPAGGPCAAPSAAQPGLAVAHGFRVRSSCTCRVKLAHPRVR